LFKESESFASNLTVWILIHRLVEETLQPLDSKRRAFRLVGGVLVERTVGEVLPSVVTNRENVSDFSNCIVT
jgi:prefoldin subunit 2